MKSMTVSGSGQSMCRGDCWCLCCSQTEMEETDQKWYEEFLGEEQVKRSNGGFWDELEKDWDELSK